MLILSSWYKFIRCAKTKLMERFMTEFLRKNFNIKMLLVAAELKLTKRYEVNKKILSFAENINGPQVKF